MDAGGDHQMYQLRDQHLFACNWCWSRKVKFGELGAAEWDRGTAGPRREERPSVGPARGEGLPFRCASRRRGYSARCVRGPRRKGKGTWDTVDCQGLPAAEPPASARIPWFPTVVFLDGRYIFSRSQTTLLSHRGGRGRERRSRRARAEINRPPRLRARRAETRMSHAPGPAQQGRSKGGKLEFGARQIWGLPGAGG